MEWDRRRRFTHDCVHKIVINKSVTHSRMVLQSKSGDYVLGTEKQIRSALNSHPTREVKFELANGHIAFWFKSTALIFTTHLSTCLATTTLFWGTPHPFHIHASFAATPASSVPVFTTRAYIRYNLPYILCLRLHTTRLMRKNGKEIRIKDGVDDERGQRSILFIHGHNNHSLPALSAYAPYPYQGRVASRPFWLIRTTRMSSLEHNQ